MSDELAHYGVPGMKWGRRKQADGSYKSSGRKAAKDARKKEISKLSDAELRQRINRLQMEKQYMDLTTPSSTANRAVSKGARFMGSISENVLRTAVTGIAGAALSIAVSRAFPNVPQGGWGGKGNKNK